MVRLGFAAIVVLAVATAIPIAKGSEKENDGSKLGLPVDPIGMTIQEFLRKMQLKIDKFIILEEPIGTCHGVIGRIAEWGDLYLYVDKIRHQEGIVQWDISSISKMKIIGAAYLHDDNWRTSGRVIRRYHLNEAPKK